jgi:hypothetical protein
VATPKDGAGAPLANRTVTWQTSSGAVTLSSMTGYRTTVTARSAGTATVRATAGDTASGESIITVNGPPPTCSGAPAGSGTRNYDVAIAVSGCGGMVTYRANSYAEAKQCASSAGHRVVSQLCSFVVEVESGYTTEVIAPSESDARSCVAATVCASCDPRVLSRGACESY